LQERLNPHQQPAVPLLSSRHASFSLQPTINLHSLLLLLLLLLLGAVCPAAG